MEFDSLSGKVIAAAIEVHRTLGGPGLLESVYEEALVAELTASGVSVERQVICPIVYKGQKIGTPLRIDLVVEQVLIVECKAVSEHNPVFECQCLTYLRLTGLKTGLVINFGLKHLKDGIHRVVN